MCLAGGLSQMEPLPSAPPPLASSLVRAVSQRSDGGGGPGGALRPSNRVAGSLMPLQRQKFGPVLEDQIRELQCAACNSLIQSPVYAPCGHSFCQRHLAEGDTNGPTELDKTAEALRKLCLEHGILEQRARETLLLTGTEDVDKTAEVCRAAGGLEGRAVKVHPDIMQPEFQWGSVTKDSIGKVVRVEGGHASVDFPNQRRWHCLGRELEVEPVADKIKLGSVVAVRAGIRPSMGWGALEGDQTGTVVQVNSVNLVVESKGNMWFGFLGELELAPDGEDAAELSEAVVQQGVLKAAMERLSASGPSDTCRAVLAFVLKQAMAKGGKSFRMMLRGQKRTALMCTRGAMGVLRLAGFRIVKVDNFRTRTLIQSDNVHMVNRCDAIFKALEIKFGESPAISDEEDMRYKVTITVDKPTAKRSATEFDKLWEEELEGKLKPALAPAQSVWSWPRRGWKTEEDFKEHLSAELCKGSAVVAQGQTKQHARQVESILESKGMSVKVEETGKASGEAVLVGEDPTEIEIPLSWQGEVPHHARVRLKDLPEGSALSQVGAVVGIVGGQYLNQDGITYVVNFPKNAAKHVVAQNLEVVTSTDAIQVGARVKVCGSADPFFGWGGVEGSDLGVVHHILFDGVTLVYFPQLDKLWMGTLGDLTTTDLPKAIKGNCPICLEPLAHGEHLGTDRAVQAQVERIRRLMDGSRVERNDVVGGGGAADQPPKLVRTKTQEGDLTCSICMDLLVSPVTLACGHSFCKAHIEAWLLQHDSCPNCKHRVVADRLYKRKTTAPRAALFDAELRDTEQVVAQGEQEEQNHNGSRSNDNQERPEIPINQMLQSQLVRHFPKELSDRKMEIAEEVWEALQKRSTDYLQRLRGFLHQFGEAAVQQMTEKGFSDVNAKLPGTRGGTLLMLAAEQGVTSAVRELLARGANPLAVLNAEGDVGATALSLAAARGHVETLKELLCSVEWPVVRIADALASAIEQRQRASLEYLLNERADAAELSNSYGFPALVTAVQTNSKDMLTLLLKTGAKLEATVGSGILVTGAGKPELNGVYQLGGTFDGKNYYQNSNGKSIYCKGWWKIGTISLKKDGSQGWYYSMPEPRMEGDAPPDGKWTTHGYEGIDAVPPPTVQHLDRESGAVVSPLLLAVQLGFVEVAQQLIDAGADPHARLCSTGADLLQVACVGGDVGMVKLLLGAKVPLTTVDDQGKTPLHTAAAAGHHLVVKELLQAGAVADSAEMPTPLVLASCCGSYPPGPGRVWQVSVAEKYELVVEELLAARADPLRTAHDGSSVLHVAAKAGASAAAIAALIAAGARPDVSDTAGRSPFFAALHAGRSSSARALVQHMGPSDGMLKFEFQSMTPLAAAALLGDVKLVQAILDKLQQQGEDRSWLDASVNSNQPASGDLLRVVSTGFDTNFWQLVHEPLPSTSAAVASPPSLEVGDRVVLAVDYEGQGYALRGPLRPGDVGQIVKKDKGSAPWQVKIRENLFWYREGALQKYVVKTTDVQEYRGAFRHPYVENGRSIGLALEVTDGSHGRWRLAEDVIPGAQVAEVSLTRNGKGVVLRQDTGQFEFDGICDELGNLHGQVVNLAHRSGHFVFLPASDDVTVRCPRHHAMERMSGLGKRRCSCDVCGKSICRDEPLFFTCHSCNYDTCGSCCGARLFTRLPAEHPVHLSSWAPLHFAAAAGHSEVAKLLISARANTMAKDVFGRTPLHWAAAAGVAFMVEMLAFEQGVGSQAAALADLHGFIPLKLVSPEMLRFAANSVDDTDQIHGNAVEVGRPEGTVPGDAGAAGLYTLAGERDGKPLYKRTDGPGWAVCWDKKTSRWGLYREKYEADSIQYESKSNTAKCPARGWVPVAAADPSPSFEEALPWRVGNMLLKATPACSRPKPYDLKAIAGGLPPLDEHRKKEGLQLTVSRTAAGGISITLPGGDAAPTELLQLLIMEMIRRGDLPPEPPPGCVLM